ncbi:hypothetical protein Pmani_038792 [Petrolisthes manimaculis]|uniref:Hexosyltransferase n=1 Tax=Petrolisthes manimaculis TaxID=1843537 RepID=A0AAE1TK32_9EUCA|nr:hypothetical protein Pmani_038792 [Petrolisthes manimaculis]
MRWVVPRSKNTCVGIGFIVTLCTFIYFTDLLQPTTDLLHQERKVELTATLDNNNNNNNNTTSDIVTLDPLHPRVPHSLLDHVYFSSYDGSSVYDNREGTGGTTRRRPLRLETLMFDQVRDEAIKFLTTKFQVTYTRKECSDLRYRNLPTVGMEVDVLCRRRSSSPEVDRVTLMLPVRNPRVVFHSRPTTASLPTAASINIVMPLEGRIDTLRLFLENLQQVIKESHLHLGLTVVYFEDGKSEAARTTLQEAASHTPDLVTHFLLLQPQQFSRSRALKEGVEKSNVTAPVVFLCDVDVLFTSTFLHRCLATPVRGKQVFFPMVFSQYNPELVYALHGRRQPPPLQTLSVQDNEGFWRVWGHGMMCVYKSDFLAINGFNPSKTGWGGEDLNFLSKTAARRFKIVRSLDYGLFHHYHPKDCSQAGKGQSWPCAKLRAMSEASSLSFGLWFFRHQYNSSSWGILREKERWEERVREEQENIQYDIGGFSENTQLALTTLLVLLLLNILLTLHLCLRYLHNAKK